MKIQQTLTFLIPIGLVATAVGCGEVGGGAAVIPNVTVKLADAEIGGGGGETGTGTTVDPATTANSGPGVFKGRVVLDGTAPTLTAKPADKDPAVCGTPPNESLIVGESNGVKNVFIYLAKAPKGAPKVPVPDEPVIFDQKGCTFEPHCLLVRKTQVVKILSNDPIAHNTHTFPKRNPQFNQGIKAMDREGTDLQYKSAESVPFSVKCDYHNWMNAYHLPLDHPYAALTDENGAFEIKDIPAGKYNFVIWHEGVKGGYLYRKYPVTISADKPVDGDIKYPVAKFQPPK